ncbi:MAG TPA: hypothetical protein DEA08_01565, partial [Planctomycetes bacterium]|nr:hypothetical protein [Planctomycetota bacterium]
YSFGQSTDDTQLARELLQSWVELGRFDPADFGRRVGAIFSEARIVGRGRATEAAAKALAAGTPWDQAGTHQRLRRRRRDLGLALNPENFWASLPFQGGTTWVALGRNRLGSRPKSCGAARLPPILRRCAKAAAIWAAKPPSNLLVEPTTQGRKL